MLDQCAENGGPSWTLPRMAAWLEQERGARIHSAHLSVLIKRDGYRYKRTRTTVRPRPTKPSSRSQRISWRACGCTAEGRIRRPPGTPGPAAAPARSSSRPRKTLGWKTPAQRVAPCGQTRVQL
ncbi:winged helix-turn-helix domain-containing protein [Streptomyces sp. NRRL F-2664]|uniref:winged helix-turn-helix domain-containing protein n=1 Tax=Streptomyces sp. NRRL F-2664 TaxID=1463842 RepID=UPI0009988B80